MMIINVKKTFSAVSAAIALCCWVFADTARAQSDDLWGDYNSSAPTEMSLPESEAPAGWEPLEKPAANDKPAKAAKPEKSPKTAKAPKEARPKAAPVGGEDRTFNIFVNTGVGLWFGQGGYLVRELDGNSSGYPRVIDDSQDYYINLGQGLRFEAGAGYMATPNVETRFSVDFNFGLLAPTVEYSLADGKYTVDYSYFSWGAKVMAVPQFEMLELFEMYVGAGVSLNFAYGTRDSTFIQQSTNYNSNTIYEMQFDPIMGFCGLIGFISPLSDMMDFLGELQFESKSFTLNKQRMKDHKPLIQGSSNDPGDEEYKKDDRAYAARPFYPGSNWGIRVGLRFWFGL